MKTLVGLFRIPYYTFVEVDEFPTNAVANRWLASPTISTRKNDLLLCVGDDRLTCYGGAVVRAGKGPREILSIRPERHAPTDPWINEHYAFNCIWNEITFDNIFQKLAVYQIYPEVCHRIFAALLLSVVDQMTPIPAYERKILCDMRNGKPVDRLPSKNTSIGIHHRAYDTLIRYHNHLRDNFTDHQIIMQMILHAQKKICGDENEAYRLLDQEIKRVVTLKRFVKMLHMRR